MSARKIYKCDICRNEKDQSLVIGFYFSDNHNFKFASAQSTDGFHGCVDCLKQLQYLLSTTDLSPSGVAQ